MKIRAFLISFVFEVVLSTEFPSYIPRCSLSDPCLGKCLTENGNIAISELVKGDDEVGFPVLSPLRIPNLKLKGENLKIEITDAHTDDIKNIKLVSAGYEQLNEFVFYAASVDVFTITGKYSISKGNINSYPVSGEGEFNITLINNLLNYTGNVAYYDKNDVLYAGIVNSSMELITERAYYEFEDLYTPQTGIEINAFINENWEIVFAEIKPSMEQYFLFLFQYVIDVVTDTFPYFVYFMK